ncbi:Hypothetical predicted protein [Mytilus galloprovincialis]|uniref:C1q domain-containing protein n=1 Tax=Mytilus galloprovincialis TaxID=29158 RepID=A0A8B6FA99_MYTGA|nr:Hypothetical predicted protein [Mytilus galloprovincialis]
MKVFVFISFILHSSGFLLNTASQLPTTKDPIIIDKHFDMLLDLILEQRRSQRKQDQEITQLRQDVLAVQQELALCKLNNQNIDSSETRFIVLENKTEKLQMELENTSKYVNSMKVEFQINYVTVNKSKELEHDIESLKNLKAINNLHALFDVRNQTRHIENELQKTNSKLDATVSDAEARKQDFLALYQKADLTEQQLEERWMQLSKRVILSARLLRASYKGGQRIKLGNIEVANGVQNISSIKESSVFTCEKHGIYFISVYITTNSIQSRFLVLKNGKTFAEAFYSFGSQYQTGTTLFVTNLNVSDTFEMVAYTDMFVYGVYESGITITQLQ